MKHLLWIKERWKLTLPKDAISPTGSIYQTHDIVTQTYVISHLKNSRILHSAGPFTVRYKTKSSRIRELSARLT